MALIRKYGKLTTIVAILVVSLVVMAGCGSSKQGQTPQTQPSQGNQQEAAKPIVLGALLPKSGAGADWGKKQEISVQIAVDQINAAGGINGSQIVVKAEDTGSNKQQAVTLTRKFINDDKVAAILGPFFSGECEVAYPQANQIGVPIISASSAKPGLSEAFRPWGFRNSMTDDKMLADAIPKFIAKYNIKKVVIVHDAKDAWSVSVGATLLPEIFKQNGVEVVNAGKFITYQTGDTDYTAQVTALKQYKDADAVGIGGLYNEAASIAQEMKRQGVKIPAIGGGGMYSAALIQQGGEAVEGWVATSSWWVDSPDPRVTEFKEKFRPEAAKITPKDDLPGTYDANIFETIYMIAEILKSTKLNGNSTPEELRTAIRDGLTNLKDFDGITGKSSMDAKGDGVKTSYPLIIQNGRYELIK